MVAGEHGPQEIRRVLEGTPDFMANVLGPAYAGGVDLLVAYTKIGTKPTQDEERLAARLLLRLHSINVKIMTTHTSAEKFISIASISAELHLVQAYAGLEDCHCLESIDWNSAFVFSNGCRAPPWRQAQGDLGYITAKPSESDYLTILVNFKGVWTIVGASSTDGEMDYDRVGEIYPSLLMLLRAKSPHFEETFPKQEAALYLPGQDTQADLQAYLQQSSSTASLRLSSNDITVSSRTASAITRDQRRKKLHAKALQPSQKWSNLGLDLDTRKPSRTVATTAGVATKASHHSLASSTRGVRHTSRRTTNPGESESSEDEEVEMEKKIKTSDLPPEYWSIQKLVKYLSGGNQTASIIALCSLRDFDLTAEACQLAIRDGGGLDLLINLLETDDARCKIGALRILKEISLSYHVKVAIANLDGMRPLVALLGEDQAQIQCLAAATIANCAKLPRNRLRVRFFNGIEKLVGLLRAPSGANGENELARCAALGLWSCSLSDRNKVRILAADATPLLGKLLQSPNVPLAIPVVGVLEECANQQQFRDLIRDQGIVAHLVANLSREHATQELQAHSANALFKCAYDPLTRTLLRDGLAPLVALLQHSDPQLRFGVTGAIWKCAEDETNRQMLLELKALEQLTALLTNQPEEVIVNVAGAVCELATSTKARKVVRSAGGLDALVKLLSSTNEALLINVTKAVGSCAQEVDSMATIDKLDGVRLLWSLLKSSNPEVVSNAAWALCPCIANAKESGDMVRSFVGGLELIVGLLKSDSMDVVSSVCAAIGEIAKDQENLAVITDHGVVPLLGRLARTFNPKLQQHLATAVANCCAWGDNREAFGKAGAVAPLVKYLKSADNTVTRNTAVALNHLSRHAKNCITMHEAGVVKLLLAMVGTEDEVLQINAATCINNIRRLALASERAQGHS